MNIMSHLLDIATAAEVDVHNISPAVEELLRQTPIRNGFVTASSRHTTTAVTINEDEVRLREDLKAFLARLVPKDGHYLHNDIHLRDCPADEPQNAHSHIAAMLLGSSEVIPLIDGKLGLGMWQSLLFVDLDGPRNRTVSIQIIGQ
jgi:secondary thiamine-phosphate synthase enzyme